MNFNPRSLTGATLHNMCSGGSEQYFNPRSLTGATGEPAKGITLSLISIHAPSRERHTATTSMFWAEIFQSTLPHGSDLAMIESSFLS